MDNAVDGAFIRRAVEASDLEALRAALYQASHDPELAELAWLERDGYDLLLRFRCLTGLKRNDDGRFINPSDLNRLEREQLANVFDVQRMVQNTVRQHFKLETSR